MKTIEIIKHNKVETTDHEQEGIAAFQMVTFVIDFFGRQTKETMDTKITKEGRQFVIDGNGWIEEGYEITV